MPHGLFVLQSIGMAHTQIQRLEQRLHSATASQAQLTSQNATLLSKLAEANARISFLESQFDKKLTSAHTPQDFHAKLCQLEEQLHGLNYELAFYQQNDINRIKTITDLQERLFQLELQLQKQTITRQQIEVQLEEALTAKLKAVKRNQKMSARLEEVNQARMKLLTENGELKGTLDQQREQHRQSLTSLSKSLQSLEKFLNYQPSQPQQSSFIADDFQCILKQQTMQLEERNTEILNLKHFCEGSQPSLGEAHLKHTIKCLRSQLCRYSSLAGNIVQKLTLAEESVKRYNQAAQKCEKEAEGINVLRSENMSLLKLVKYQEEKMKELKQSAQTHDKLHKERAQILVKVLSENSFLHDLLFRTYGQSQQSFLHDEKRKYDEKHSALAASSYWTNVEELIEMNERLRKKIKESVK